MSIHTIFRQLYHKICKNSTDLCQHKIRVKLFTTAKLPQKRTAKPRMLKIDWYTLPAPAGTGTFLYSDLAEELFVPESAEAEQADFVISVGGDSMEPTYHDGDKVFVEKCDAIEVGEVGIFVLNGEVYIKELGNKCLISHNEKYKPIRIGENDSVYCYGRVIGFVE